MLLRIILWRCVHRTVAVDTPLLPGTAAPPALSFPALNGGACRAPMVTPAELVSALGLAEQSPAIPQWLAAWSASCDQMSQDLRDEAL